ncbi:UNVERIFIED_CONTAM: NAC domain-containing protein 72 [Sesamum latifolium]|uniref:NAC domain-containing protein 72 n=1 Tax=Sesamum latifolium TaxID=2727402 RepID=A0AAW2Y536_9LAMI
MSSIRTCMSSSDFNVIGYMNAVVREEYPGSSSTSTMMNSLPVGYRFLPTDTELIVHYLKRKVNNQPLPCNNIHTVNLYELRPEDLCAMLGGKEWYLFCPRKRRSSSDTRADRTTRYGYWHATSGDRAIRHNGKEIGYRKTLVYYMNDKSHNTTARKTNWIMHEYRLKNHSDSAPSDAPDNVDHRLSDDTVLCRIHHHNKKYKSNNDGATNVSNEWNEPNPIRAAEDVDHQQQQQQQTFSAAYEDSEALTPATTFTTPFSMPEIDDDVLFLGSDSPKQGCPDQYKSWSDDLFDGFDELMEKGMQFLPDVMTMDFWLHSVRNALEFVSAL